MKDCHYSCEYVYSLKLRTKHALYHIILISGFQISHYNKHGRN